MLVSLNWLKNYVDISEISPEQLANLITKSGIEVEGIEYIAKESEHIVVGYVEICEKHPNADKLNICSVDVGEEENLQIICGAPNVAQGQKVVVAKPGAILPGNIKIKRVKLRGIESNGMICSLQELGVDEKYVPNEYAEGIYVFPDDVNIGEPVAPLLNLDDAILEFDLTPNRSDSLSMLGVAYEVAAILDQPIKLPKVDVNEGQGKANQYVSVKVDQAELCPYYGAFIIKDVEIKPSPLWMRNYLMAAGIRPINNVVDITNFVLLEYGQPLHAFDYDRVETREIVVRRAHNDEKMVTLDDVERTLSDEHLVITDGAKPIALAGVMGGANTEVHDGTKNILLEAASFDPISIRKAVNTTGLRSEASTRFEKGIDPNRIKKAGLRACQLLEKYANGEVQTGVVEYDQLDRSEKTVEFTTEEVNHRLGTNIMPEEVAHILRRLRFQYEQQNNYFKVRIPTRRGDISIFEDMLEEIARIYGYDRLPFTLPKHFSQAGALTERQQLIRKIHQFLQGAGLMETRTYSLTNKDLVTKLMSEEVKEFKPQPISVARPMTEDHRYLRLSILPELLKSIGYNLARNQNNLAYYEMGKIFISNEKVISKQPKEQLRLAGAITGKWFLHEWQQEDKQVDFFVVKGIVEGLFQYLNIDVEFTPAQLAEMHPGRCATLTVQGESIGFLGQIHPLLAKKMDIKETYVFDIYLEHVLELFADIPTYDPIPKYPAIKRDVAFIMDQEVKAGDVQGLIEQLGVPLVKEVHVFDLYQGENLPDGKKSVAYNLVYQDAEKTLKDDEVDESFTKIIDAVNEKYHTYVRS